nr:tetratricopeptide repeat protein [Pyrinomonadaceae bacterium]
MNARKVIKFVNALARLFAGLALLASLAAAHDGLHEQIVELTARIKHAPHNASLYLKRGELYRLHRDWRRAAADYDRAARLQPALSVVDLARGTMLFEAGRPQAAKVALDRFLGKHPAHFEALTTLARVLVKLGRRAEAEQTLTPEPELYVERARALAEPVEAGNTGEALRVLDEGVAKLGPLVTLQLYAVDLELRLKNYGAALERLDSVAVQSSRKEVWLTRRGEILLRAGQQMQAREAFAAALAAVESLPTHRRRTRAVADLEAHLRTALA